MNFIKSIIENYLDGKDVFFSILKGKFAKNLLTLGTGTLIAQLIPVLASPVLTRLYTPDQFGIFANFTAILAFFLVFYSGKFEMAIILPKSDKEAVNIVGLSFTLIIVFTFLLSIIIFFLGNRITTWLNYKEVSIWLWLVPIGALLYSTYTVLNEWLVRKNNFFSLSKNKITNTSSITGSSFIFGILNVNTGLILGQIIGQIFSVFMAFVRVLKNDKELIKFVSKKQIFYSAKKYINFSKYIIPGQLINTFSGQLPVFVLTFQFGVTVSGLFILTRRVLGVPMSFVANSFRDVFKQRAAEDFKKYGNCINIYKKVTYSLIAISFIPFVILFWTAPFLFTFIFGSQWAQSGIYARVLTIMYFTNFISMPTYWVIIIAEKQKFELIWQVILFTCTALSLLIGIWTKSALLTIVIFGIGRSIAYISLNIITYNLAKGTKTKGQTLVR